MQQILVRGNATIGLARLKRNLGYAVDVIKSGELMQRILGVNRKYYCKVSEPQWHNL